MFFHIKRRFGMNSDMILRTTNYYRILNRLRALGLEKVFAHNLADAAGVSAAVVRKDFSLLEIYGQKRGGYEIPDLLEKIGKILGKTDDPQNVIIVGCGRIGKALMHYTGFEGEVTEDGKFSLEGVRCVGCCGLAPVLTVGGEVFGKVTKDELPGIIAKFS
jgi:NADH/NAD ratio-sensing transcriptional regulator Rex